MNAEENSFINFNWYDKFTEDFRSFLNVDELVPYLYCTEQLTHDQYERIAVVMADDSPENRVDYLISVIKRKGPEAFQNFVAALKRSVEEECPRDKGNEYLLNKVQAEATMMVPPTKINGPGPGTTKHHMQEDGGVIEAKLEKVAQHLEELQNNTRTIILQSLCTVMLAICILYVCSVSV